VKAEDLCSKSKYLLVLRNAVSPLFTALTSRIWHQLQHAAMFWDPFVPALWSLKSNSQLIPPTLSKVFKTIHVILGPSIPQLRTNTSTLLWTEYFNLINKTNIRNKY
jgi:hypothetical protein